MALKIAFTYRLKKNRTRWGSARWDCLMTDTATGEEKSLGWHYRFKMNAEDHIRDLRRWEVTVARINADHDREMENLESRLNATKAKRVDRRLREKEEGS